jgi:EmrB/QacA subfamily drug resistance transporter
VTAADPLAGQSDKSEGVNEMENLNSAAVEPDPRRWKALALLCAAFFMVILDSSIVVVALPSIQRNLSVSAANLQWVLSAYLLSFGGLLLLGGRAADLLGRRRVLIAGAVLFALASLSCGLAWSTAALITARIVQGAAAALMTPTALSIVMTTFEEGPERNRALGVWAAIGGVGATAAWLIGGPITDGLGWEWIFFINVPVALAVAALSPLVLRESRDRTGRREFDVAGALTITLALVAFVYAVVNAPNKGWASGSTLGLLALAVVLIVLFGWIEARSRDPLVPLAILRSRPLLGGNLVLVALGMLAFGMPFTLTQYAQRVLDYSPVKFGLGSVVMPIAAAIGSGVAQALATRGLVRAVAVTSMLLTAAGCALLSAVSVDGTYVGDIFFGLLVFGPGLGAGYVAGSVASLAGVSDAHAGLASGLNNTSFQVGGALGVAIVSSVAIAHTAGADQAAALTNGYQSAFTAAIAFAVVGLIGALVLLRHVRAPAPTAEPAPVAA